MSFAASNSGNPLDPIETRPSRILNLAGAARNRHPDSRPFAPEYRQRDSHRRR